MFNINTVEVDLGGKTLKLETGRIARQADGAVLATMGETVVLCAVTAAKSVKNRRSEDSERTMSSKTPCLEPALAVELAVGVTDPA